MSKNHVEQLHELFGEELLSQGIKPKGLIEIDGIHHLHQDVNLVVKVNQLEEELAELINKNSELQSIVRLY